MKFSYVGRMVLGAAILVMAGRAAGQAPRELKVHLAQANNDSPYTFVRAKFIPGEVTDPWAVRFIDDRGTEIPYFVWDATTWKTAQHGRADWGGRYALINHGPGDSMDVRTARGQKVQWAVKNLPELGNRLEAQEQAAKQSPDSLCAAMYLLRYRVPALSKQRLTLRIGTKGDRAPRNQDTALELRGLPDRLAIAYKCHELLRHAGFAAGGHSGLSSHADPGRNEIERTHGIITKISVVSQTASRQGGRLDWQCTYWVFPEGGMVALEGFRIDEPAGYLGGPQELSRWQCDGDFTQRHPPTWDAPWWLHQAGTAGFVATHLFHATPLTIGFGNNPFAVNADGPDKDPRVQIDNNRLSLRWWHRIDDPAILRVMTPQPPRRPSDPPPPAPPKPTWQTNDWLYRQYVMGVGDKSDAAERALRMVLGAAAGWIDRPVSEEHIAKQLVAIMPRIGARGQTAEIGLLNVVPAVLKDDSAAVRTALGKAKDQSDRTDYYINLIRRHVERGGKASEGRKKDDPDGTPREGWTGNPSYHAELMPCYVRVLEHFELPFRQRDYEQAILRYADFTLELLGGKPLDVAKFRATCQTEWPSRVVPIMPLMLHAYTLKADPTYAKVTRAMFDDLMERVERNPHGYFPVWTWNPKADRYDTVYNPVSYERGLASPWSEGLLDVIGRQRAAQFVAAQARWFVFSGQLLDTLETDYATAIRASTHGGHTGLRNQIGIYLFDDFAFYRGLVGDLVAWSAASSQVPGATDNSGTGAYRSLELSNGGSTMLRWALGIKPGSRWLESKVERPAPNHVTLRAWNRKPLLKPTVRVAAKDAGLKVNADVLVVQLHDAAFREPAEFDVRWTADKISVTVSKAARIRLYYGVVQPAWSSNGDLLLQQRGAKEGTEAVREHVAWENGAIEWQATPGRYELVRRGK
jgi:hypothetical protein